MFTWGCKQIHVMMTTYRHEIEVVNIHPFIHLIMSTLEVVNICFWMWTDTTDRYTDVNMMSVQIKLSAYSQ